MVRRLLLIAVAILLVVSAAAIGAAYWIVSGSGARVALERQLSAWLGQPVAIADAGVTLYPRIGVSLEQVRIGEPASVVLGRLDFSTPLRALLSRRIENAEAVISDSRIEMPLPFALPDANVTSSTAAAGASTLALVSVQRIALQDVTLVSRGSEIRVDADSALNGSQLDISRFVARADGLEIAANGSINLAAGPSASLVAESPLLDLDALLALTAAFTRPREPGADPAPGAGRLVLRVTAPQARAAGVALTAFDAVVTASAGEITIDPMSFSLFGGQHEGWLAATLGEQPAVRLGSSIANLDVAQLAAFGGAPGSMTGRLSGTARIGASGADLASVLASARGIGDITIADGTIPRLDLVRTVVSFLGRSPDGAATGSAFDRITGTFALAERRLTTEDLSMETADIDVLARGSLNLDGKELDGRANLLLSEGMSAQANPTLYRYTSMGNRVVLPATVSGTLSQPRIGIDAAAAIRRGVANEVERRLRNFFERVGPL